MINPQSGTMPETPEEMVKEFYAVLPQRLPSATLGDYGLELSSSNLQRITQEILSLSLFWMEQALRVALSQDLAEHISKGIRQSIQERWETDFGLNPEHFMGFFERMEHQHGLWEELTKHGGETIAVLGEASSSVDLEGTIGAQDRQNLLALFLDLVPIEELGEIAARIEADLADS